MKLIQRVWITFEGTMVKDTLASKLTKAFFSMLKTLVKKWTIYHQAVVEIEFDLAELDCFYPGILASEEFVSHPKH